MTLQMQFGFYLISAFFVCPSVYCFPTTQQTGHVIIGTLPGHSNVCQLPTSSVTSLGGSCDFNSDVCGYDFPPNLWKQHTELYGSTIFGLVTDDDSKGLAQTFALFLSSDAAVNMSETAAITTPTVLSSTDLCLKFWYLMPNQNSKLQVFVTSLDDNSSRVVYEFEHHPVSPWKKVEIPLYINGLFKVSFVSIKENNYGYIGIDSVDLYAERIETTTSPFTTVSDKIETTEAKLNIQTTEHNQEIQTTDQNIKELTTEAFHRASTEAAWQKETTDITKESTTVPFTTTAFESTVTETKSTAHTYDQETTEHLFETTDPFTREATRSQKATTAILEVQSSSEQTTEPDIETTAYELNNHDIETTLMPELTSISEHSETTGEPVPTIDQLVLNTEHVTHDNAQLTTEQVATTHIDTNEADETTPLEQTTEIQDLTQTTEYIGIKETTSNEKTTERQQPTTDVAYIQETTEEIRFETTSQGVETTSACTCVCPTLRSMCEPVSNTITTEPNYVDSVCILPYNMKEPLTTYSCNYDNGMCGYVITAYPHLWEMTFGRYGNATVGEIIGDHSKDSSGGYLVFNTNNNNVPTNTVHVVTSPIFPSQDGGRYCLSFWYNMPTNVSVLDVFVVDAHDQHQQLVWSSSYTKTAGWTNASINIVTNNSFHVEFASKKIDNLGFVGIDDVHVAKEKLTTVRHTRDVHGQVANVFPAADKNDVAAADDDSGCSCTCPTLSDTDCTPTTEVTIKETCGINTNSSSVTSLNCAFDNRDSCMYDIPSYPHLWELAYYMYGNTTAGTINMDASKDGNGGYVVFSTNNYHVESGKSASITSTVYDHVGNMCLQFSYNMPTTQASLRVYIKTQIDTLLWKTAGTATQGWLDQSLSFVTNGTFQIVFQSTKTGLFSYVGVDDIKVFSNV